ncbi:MAG: hypothetical protein KJ793_01595, partial [Candidatus Omnitrophica bacterium]|nr:hypothetical protein [Candidatus Omnitrophota bacterium]
DSDRYFYPNYICKATTSRITEIQSAISDLRWTVSNLEQDIKNNFSKHVSNPCGPVRQRVNGEWERCSFLPSSLDIVIQKVCIKPGYDYSSGGAIGVHSRYPARLEVTFTWEADCRCCHNETIQVPNPDEDPLVDGDEFIDKVIEVCVTKEDVVGGPITTDRTDSYLCLEDWWPSEHLGTYPIQKIPCLSPAKFLDALDDLSGQLDNLSDKMFSEGVNDIATTDADLDDEFKEVSELLLEQFDSLTNFLWELDTFYQHFTGCHNAAGYAKDGGGVRTYEWEDKQGQKHSISVKVGKFLFPEIKRTKYGNWLVNKKCLEVKYPDEKNAWVKITRRDPGVLSVSSTGKHDLGLQWNPLYNDMIITRKARAHYRAYDVGLDSVGEPGELFDGE